MPRHQFSLRSIFWLTAAVAVLCWVGAPLAVPVLSLLAVLAAAVLLLGTWGILFLGNWGPKAVQADEEGPRAYRAMKMPWLVVGTLIGVAGFMFISPCFSGDHPALWIALAFWMIVGIRIGLYLDATKGGPPGSSPPPPATQS